MPTMEEIENGNAYGLRLTLLAPRGRGQSLSKILTTLTGWIDPSKQIIDVDEFFPEESKLKTPKKPVTLRGCLVTPALSVMLFVRENGKMCFDDVEKILKDPPWEFHHKVELQNKSAPSKSLAKQEFFKLADDLPLFATCPVLTGNEHLRINLYVHNFSAMVEFYRIITDTEIETSKPGFCIFELYRQPGLDIQLSLKRSPHIYPLPVDSAYVSFNVKNIKMIKLGTNSRVDHVGSNIYTTRDPDGNLVVLYETNLSHSNDCCSLAGACCKNSSCLCLKTSLSVLDVSSGIFDDGKSFKSVTESHDSGRYSDVENTNLDSTLCLSKRISKERRSNSRHENKREKSEGYASSNSSKDTSQQMVDVRRNSSLVLNTHTKRIVTNDKYPRSSHSSSLEVASNDPGTSRESNCAPVFI